jgi:hypothetical protein
MRAISHLECIAWDSLAILPPKPLRAGQCFIRRVELSGKGTHNIARRGTYTKKYKILLLFGDHLGDLLRISPAYVIPLDRERLFRA